jgi:transcriptional regulator
LKEFDPMYQPSYFQENEPSILIETASRIQLGCIVTTAPDGLHITHAPCVLKQVGDETYVEFHVARGNPHWKMDAAAQTVAIFQGEQTYVHPAWYPTKKETGKAVPTWMYVTVHMHGVLEVMEDNAELHRHLEELTIQNEGGRPDEWKVSDAPADYMEKMKRGIVGLRLRVARMEGAWKLNQHKNEADHSGVAAGLRDVDAASARVAELMERARVKPSA